MKPARFLLCLLASTLLLPGCKTTTGEAASSQRPAASPAPPELLQEKTLDEIVRHLYRWYWDESDIERAADLKEWVFWVRPIEVKRDAGDDSVFADVLLPQLGTDVHLKKADYSIEEMKLRVKSGNFHIKNVTKVTAPLAPPPGSEVVKIKTADLKEFLTRTRNQPDYPSPELLDRMRGALRKELGEEASASTNKITGEQTVFIAPLSPVGNDIWVFWENRKLLIRFASDIDLTNPAVWEHETLMTHVYDPYSQMVISLDEAEGSNRYLTRNQIGRALYNCIILGQRVTVTPRP